MGSRWMRNSFVYLMILVAVIAIVVVFFRPSSDSTTTQPLSTVIADAKDGNIEKLEVEGNKLTVKTSGGSEYTSRKEEGASIVSILSENGIPAEGVNIEIKEASKLGDWLGLLLNFLPILIFIGLIFFMMRQAQGSNSQAMSFGKSRARMFTANKPSVTFNDVAGVDEAKGELEEVVEFLKYPEKFIALGARIPRGVLLVGPPGTGKTLLARAVAGEAGVPFFSISGSEFVEMFVGVGASRVRDLFDQAKRNSPCIVFVDEIDAVGRQRGAGLGGSHDEREQTLNQILVEMDGFDTNTNVIVIAATNRPDILDPALLRPGRFDRQVVIDAPDVKGRVAILEVHSKGKPLDKEVSLDNLAKRTPGFSGADLANLVNEAAILAARVNKKRVGMHEFEEAIDRVMMGPERKSRVRSARENEMVAYHESGHAIVAYMLEDFDPLYKITIVSRGMAGGYTLALPEEDRHINTKAYLEKRLAMALGGHAAEEIVFGEMSTGPSDDISKVTKLARSMVTRYGMSERLGPRTFGQKEELIFLGREISEQRDYSEKVAEEIDDEVRRIIDRAHDLARQILRDHREKLDQLAHKLMEVETLEGEQLAALMESPADGNSPPAVDAPASPPPTTPPPVEPETRPDDDTPRGRPRPGLAWGSN
ncbi:MAG TPA: ATP-dependent zinc metalloprotease FtsH [Dehalococcoidia bacterium]|nr:ATP-dependent zinc metalloprotease FtsH [Dehalococcoidia bacterium]